MTIDTTTPRSRRALLAAAAGGLTALAAQALGRPAPALAANGGNVVLGTNNYETSRTLVKNETSGSTALWADALDAGTALYATSDSGMGVSGYSRDGTGVRGHSVYQAGVYGFCGGSLASAVPTPASKTGVYGRSDATDGYGVKGRASAGTGILGYTSGGYPRAGVFGDAGADGIGVRARSVDGSGVLAASTGGRGVLATSVDGTAVDAGSTNGIGVNAWGGWGGVWADSDDGIALFANCQTSYAVYGFTNSNTRPAVYGRGSHNTGIMGHVGNGVPDSPAATAVFALAEGAGTAFEASGPVKFSSAGLATIQAGDSAVTVTPGVAIAGTTKILTTLHGSPGGATTIQRVVRHADTDTFTIYATANVANDCPVSWFVIS